MSEPRYVEIQVTSHFSFLRGASSCEELFAQAGAIASPRNGPAKVIDLSLAA